MHFNDWRIGARLALGFGALMALVLLTALNGASRMRHIDAAAQQLAQDRFPKLTWAKALDQHISDIGKAGYGLMLAPDAKFADSQKQEIAAARQEMGQELQKLDAKVRSEKGRAILKSLTAAQAAFSAKVDEVLKLQADGRKQEALELMLAGMRDARYALKQQIDELVTYQNQLVEAGVADAEAAYETGLALLVGLSVLGVIALASRGGRRAR